MRYEIRHIGDPDCTTVNDEVLTSTDDLTEATRLASQHSSAPYGTAILDTETGQIDYGAGFGAELPDPEA